jgi:predicted Zn-dependent protease
MAIFMLRALSCVQSGLEVETILAQVTALIGNLEKLLDTPRDGALLRFSLGNEYFKAGDHIKAARYLNDAVEKDPAYSAAWKLLGKALLEAGNAAGALEAYRNGIAAAQKRGDKQAEKEMSVFARRLEKTLGAGN